MHAAPYDIDGRLLAGGASIKVAVSSSSPRSYYDYYSYKSTLEQVIGAAFSLDGNNNNNNYIHFLITTLFALVCPLLICHCYSRLRNMQAHNTRPFPFESLPQELRDMVYEYLLEDPIYPAPAPTRPSASLWKLPSWPSTTSTNPAPRQQQQQQQQQQPPAPASPRKPASWLLLANKRIHAEFIDMLTKRTTFHLVVSPTNPAACVSSPSPTITTNNNNNNNTKLWTINPQTLKAARRATIQLTTTSSMLGASDPRSMATSSWTLAARMRAELACLSADADVTMDAKAIGDPLWNPLWIWYHSAVSFKSMGTALALSEPGKGPRLRKLTFSLDTWSPGENYLARDDSEDGDGGWCWWCTEGHRVCVDSCSYGGDTAGGAGAGVGGTGGSVREFCGRLYQECSVCRGEDDRSSSSP